MDMILSLLGGGSEASAAGSAAASGAAGGMSGFASLLGGLATGKNDASKSGVSNDMFDLLKGANDDGIKAKKARQQQQGGQDLMSLFPGMFS